MQSSVLTNLGFGVVGEFYDDGPRRVRPAILVSSDVTQNVIGRVCTVTNLGDAADGSAQVVTAGGTGTFAGILVGPKEYATSGNTTGTLTPTLRLPNYTTVELVVMGSLVVAFPAAAGDTSAVYYDNTTGVLGIGTATTGQTQLSNAKVVRFATAAAGLGVLQLTY